MPATNPNILPPERLAEIAARAEKATPAPWEGQHYNLAGLVDSFGVEAANDVVICAVEKAKITVGQAADNALFIAHARADVPALLAHAEALAGEVERLRSVERTLLPQTADGHSIGLGSSIWGLFETEDGDRFWAVAEVTATYESACERTIDAQMVIDRDTRIECEPSSYFSYAYHPETGQSADEARAAIDAARGASDARN